MSSPSPPPRWPRAFACRCGRPIFFRNDRCLACGAQLGFDAERLTMVAFDADAPQAAWRCAEHRTASGCNWLVDPADAHAGTPARCRSCRLLRTVPDLSSAENAAWFGTVESARRMLVASLLGFGLPVQPKSQDPRGLAFDILRAPPVGPPVVTGHADGVITIDLEEADDARREARRLALREPYRTLLGHFRHESGHYYWWRLIDGDAQRLAQWREVFGDERADYAAALQRHYTEGVPPDWLLRHVSAYASAHPWEDWAETWAHYLHLSDTLDTARSYGLDGSMVALDYEPLPAGDDIDDRFAEVAVSLMQLTGVLNELSRAMGVADFYPFVLSATALRKLHAVHRLVAEAGARLAGAPRDDPAAPDRETAALRS